MFMIIGDTTTVDKPVYWLFDRVANGIRESPKSSIMEFCVIQRKRVKPNKGYPRRYGSWHYGQDLSVQPLFKIVTIDGTNHITGSAQESEHPGYSKHENKSHCRTWMFKECSKLSTFQHKYLFIVPVKWHDADVTIIYKYRYQLVWPEQ